MMKPIKLIIGLFCAALSTIFIACAEEQPAFKVIDKDNTSTTAFASGADISWITKFEHHGVKFYNQQNEERECTQLMKEIGMNTIRLRVWVNTIDGGCNVDDVVVKALRDKQLGMRMMVNFQYSDSGADTGLQYIPAAWDN